MNVFDLIFIGLFLSTILYLVRIGWLAVRGRRATAIKHLKRLGLGFGGYFAIVMAVGLLSPRRTLGAEEILRYDDWCLIVEKAVTMGRIGELQAAPDRMFVAVTLRVSSEARRVRQAAPKGSLVFLLDGSGQRYDVSLGGQAAFEKMNGLQPELTRKLDPQTSLLTIRIFDVRSNATRIALAHRHGSGFPFPGAFIIGEGFRKPPVILLSLQ